MLRIDFLPVNIPTHFCFRKYWQMSIAFMFLMLRGISFRVSPLLRNHPTRGLQATFGCHEMCSNWIHYWCHESHYNQHENLKIAAPNHPSPRQVAPPQRPPAWRYPSPLLALCARCFQRPSALRPRGAICCSSTWAPWLMREPMQQRVSSLGIHSAALNHHYTRSICLLRMHSG